MKPVALLAEHGDEAKLLAGGHSLIPMMRFRLTTPTVLVESPLKIDDLFCAIGFSLTRQIRMKGLKAGAQICSVR